MLTPEIRTMDMCRVIELLDTDKETLKDELLEDYTMLKIKYRKLTKEYNQKSNMEAKLSNKYYSHDKINYKKELGVEETLYGHIRYTNNLVDNINIANEYSKSIKLFGEAIVAWQLKEIVRLKAREIEKLLKKLEVKVNYIKDFESEIDEWLKEDISCIKPI